MQINKNQAINHDNIPIIAVIPARGGSKSIKGKNLYPLGGKPLIQWSLEVALETPEISKVIVSTDDAEIANFVSGFNVNIHHRPPELSTDTALVIDTVRHVLHQEVTIAPCDDMIMVLLEPTCPLRDVTMVRQCINKMLTEHLDSVATFSPACVNPLRCWKMDNNNEPRPYLEGAVPWMPRQKLAPAYQLNGAVYAFRPLKLDEHSVSLLFGNMQAVLIDEDATLIDIDTLMDFKIAQTLLTARNGT